MYIDKIPESAHQMIERLRQIVHEAGAHWCGVQSAIPPALPMVVFINPATKHTMSVPVNDDTNFDHIELLTAIANRLAADDDRFNDMKVSIRVAVLKNLSERLIALSKDLDSIWRKPQ